MIVNQAMRMVRVDGGGGGGGGRGVHERAGVSAGQALVAGLCTPAVRGLQEVLGHRHVEAAVGVALADQGEGRATLQGSRQERERDWGEGRVEANAGGLSPQSHACVRGCHDVQHSLSFSIYKLID